MNPCFFVIVLLHLSLSTAINFTQVFEWPQGMDYEWASVAQMVQALDERTFIPDKIEPLFMAVYGTRIFLSLEKVDGIPVTLVSLPTRSAASPKLTPFPSWDMHGETGDCSKIQVAKGLEVDSNGRLWVLDSGSGKCNAKLWFIHLSNMDQTELIHEFQYRGYTQVHDFVLDETPNGFMAYISSRRERHIVVFSLERKQSWLVGTSGIEVASIALSPKGELRKLYLSKWNSYELFSLSVDALRKGTRNAYPKLIGKWTRNSYRMLMDNHETMYTAFWGSTQILSWNTSQPFQEQRFHEMENLVLYKPFTFALDSSGIFWITELNKTVASWPRYRLLMAAVGAKSYIFETSSERSSFSIPTTTTSSTPAEKNAATEVQESCIPIENSNKNVIIIIIIVALTCCNVLLSLIILWPILGPKMNKLFTPHNTIEAKQLFSFRDNKDDVGEQLEAVTYETRSQSRPLRRVPTGRRFFSVCNLSESDASEAEGVLLTFGEEPRAPVENDDVSLAEQGHLYDEVALEPSRSPH